MKKRHCLLPCLLLSFALAACGGDSEESRIEATLREALLGDDPAKCTELMTADYREQVAGEEGEAALRECEEEIEDETDPETEAVTVRGVEVGGSTATAQVALEGGSFDGQTLEMSLVRDGDRWKADEVVRFAKLDRGPFIKSLETSIEEEGELSEEQGRCIVDSLATAPRQRFEGVALHRSDADAIWLAQTCPEHLFRGPDEGRVLRTIAKFFSGKDPAVCLELATPRYLEQGTREKGVAAIETCTEAVRVRFELTNIVRVTEIVVNGSRATGNAEVLTEGLGLKGQVLTLELVKERGHWRIDRNLGYDRIDRFALAKGILQGIGAVGVDVTRSMTACVSAVLDRLPRPKVESLLLYPSVPLSMRLFGHCLDGARERPPTL